MIHLTQRQINHGVFAFMTCVSLVLLVLSFTMIGEVSEVDVLLPLVGGFISCAGLWFAYWRGWEYARPMIIVLFTLIFVIGMPADSLQRGVFSHAIYIVPALALVLTSAVWVLGSALTALAAFAYRAGGGAYTDPSTLAVFAFIIGGMIFSRLAVDNTQRLEVATREAEQARAQAEQRELEVASQAAELAQRNAEQQRLIELVATLETPTVALADGVLLAPLVGTLDSRRAQKLTARLLREVGLQRAKQVILDISGVTTVDTQVAQALIQTAHALRLLGCHVILTGISPNVATTLTQLGVQLEGMTTLRSPQDALTSLSA